MEIGKLRSISDAELDLVRQWRNSPSVRRNMYTRHEISAEEHKGWWQRTRQRADQQYWMYERQGTPLGVVAFTAIDPVNENSCWAFYASPNAPRGTGSLMEILALDHAFSDMGMYKLYCEVLAFNTAVIKLHQKFGFGVEGVFRQHHKVDGTFVDIYRLGLFASEWAERREDLVDRIIAAAGRRE